MPAVLGRDELGPRLIVHCDGCSASIVAFGEMNEEFEEVRSRVLAEGWTEPAPGRWLCFKCTETARDGTVADA